MIHVFHGFLGSPNDFAFLAREGVLLHDLYEAKEHSIAPEDTLIGYSMGGRVVLELAASVNFNIKKLVLINAHPGLATNEERRERRIFEEKVLLELRTRTLQDFLTWWNALPVFAHDLPLVTTPERFQRSPELFERFRLSEQQDFLPEIVAHGHKVLYVAGLFDEKYMDLATELFLPHDLRVKGIPGGHRLFQKQAELLALLEEEMIL